MKQDKEYPATHSMSTAWYMVDDEGNVGIMEYEENGPVPYGIEESLSFDDLLFGYDDGVNDIVKFDLTDEQVSVFLKNPCNPSQYEWYGNCIVKIDTTKTERFLKLSAYKGEKNISCCCISKNMGVYFIDTWRCVKDYSKQVIEGVLKTMLDENIIVEVYDFKEIDSLDFEEIDLKYDYPYYLYSQPYNPKLLQKKVFTPKNPVKISQIPEYFRNKIHRIKGCFKDLENIQIAQRYQCKFYGWESSYIIDGVIYELITLEDGNKGYVKTDILAYPFKDYCPDAKQSSCNEYCLDRLYEINNKIIDTDKPTVLLICSYYNYFANKISFLSTQSCIIEYSEFVPCAYFPEYESNLKDYLDEISRRAKPYLEKMIEYMNPYVIVSDNDYFEVLKQTYGISNGEIEINNNIYPIYNIDDINEYKEEIIQLANQEYRGIYYPMVISQEEMQELEKENIAIKIKD